MTTAREMVTLSLDHSPTALEIQRKLSPGGVRRRPCARSAPAGAPHENYVEDLKVGFESG